MRSPGFCGIVTPREFARNRGCGGRADCRRRQPSEALCALPHIYHWAPWPRLSASKGADMSRKLIIPLLAGCIGTQPSTAHDIYSHLADSEGAACCNQTDCAPATRAIPAAGTGAGSILVLAYSRSR